MATADETVDHTMSGTDAADDGTLVCVPADAPLDVRPGRSARFVEVVSEKSR